MPAPFRILHLSDLHLGDDILWRSVAKLRRWKSPAISSLTQGLSDAIRELKPEYVIVSGDIVNKAAQKTYRDAAACLRRVFTDAGFDLRERVLIVPGNHDVSFFPKRHEDDWKRLELYRAFLLAFYGETDVDSRRPWALGKNRPVGLG